MACLPVPEMMSQGPQQTPVGVIKASQGGFRAARLTF